MGYYIKLNNGNIVGFVSSVSAPGGYVGINDADGETLRHCSNFAKFKLENGSLVERVISPPVPRSITPWQIRKALNQIGLRSAVEAAVAASTDQDLKDGWAVATEFNRLSPFVIDMGAALGKTDAELDALFVLGASM